MIKRDFKAIPLDGGTNPPLKYIVTYTVECPAVGPENKIAQIHLLRSVVENQGLLDCGPVPFNILKMVHDGTAWVLTLETKA